MVAKTYEIMNVRDLWTANHMTPAGEPIISIQKMCRDGGQLVIPELSYGADAEDRGAEFPPLAIDICTAGPLALPVPEIYFVKDCIVWSKYGIVTVGNYLLKESLFSFPTHLMPEVSLLGERYFEDRAELACDFGPSATLENAISILSGHHESYYHYLMFFLPKLDPSVFYSNEWDFNAGVPCVIAPSGLLDYQADSLARLCDNFGASCLMLEEKACVRVKTLALPVIFRSGGLVPHPLIRRPLDMLRNSYLPIMSECKPSKIYISCRDKNNPKLENEPEIEKLVSSYGFSVVSLTDLCLSTQINLFSNATHIIAAHGDALTNIVFCKISTNILEINMLSYTNWCYRRLAGAYGLNYGCIWGEPILLGQGLFDMRYHLNPDSLMSVLTDPNFLQTGSLCETPAAPTRLSPDRLGD